MYQAQETGKRNIIREDSIFSAMVVYGFLNYEDGYVSIPNKERMGCFVDAAGAILTADIIGREYRKGAVIYTASPVH